MENGKVESNEISGFYDKFSRQQLKTGINLRHYYLFSQILKSGLKRNSKVLEIGCGIGTLTKLVADYVKKGEVTGVDISPENIEIAKSRLRKSDHVRFVVSDMTDFMEGKLYDFILLADVIEHIPVENHKALFKTLSDHMHPGSLIFINVPHPQSIEYYRRNDPSKLQIIDQSIYAGQLMPDVEGNGLLLKKYFSYSLFHDQDDYAVVVFKKAGELRFGKKPKTVISVKKAYYRFLCLMARFF
jgi:2-polyprenyl-3-methyl-5-hydroxy-6-metoxy-1,4-benzoquinol methylase